MKRIKYILAAALVALTLGVAHQRTAATQSPPPCPPCGVQIAEGPIGEEPRTRPGVQASEPLAEGELETDGYDLKKATKGA